MNTPKILQLMISVILGLFMVACGTPTAVSTPTQAASAVPTAPQPTVTLAPTQAATEIQPANSQVTEVQPTEASPIVILQGQFQGVDRDHTGSGTATIYQMPDGSYLLSFENFSVCCGPDLYVFLARKSSPAGNSDTGEYIELSALEAITGDQNYGIPSDTDLSQVKSVVIYCKPYQVVISSAPLR